MNMLNVLNEINWLAVGLASLGVFILGGLWFTIFFGKAYATSLGREFDPKEKPAALFIVAPLICTIISTITSAILLRALEITSISNALIFAVVIGLGYIISTMLNIAINPNMPKPFKYAAINAPYFLLNNIIISLILVVMG